MQRILSAVDFIEFKNDFFHVKLLLAQWLVGCFNVCLIRSRFL